MYDEDIKIYFTAKEKLEKMKKEIYDSLNMAMTVEELRAKYKTLCNAYDIAENWQGVENTVDALHKILSERGWEIAFYQRSENNE